jgi:predicted metal-dependent hydrolase
MAKPKKNKNKKKKKKAQRSTSPSSGASDSKKQDQITSTVREIPSVKEGYYKSWVQIEGLWFELKIHDEKRRNSRISVGPHSINMRVPVQLPTEAKNVEVHRLWEAAQEEVKKNWDYYARYAPPKHYDGQIIEIFPLEMRLNIIRRPVQTEQIELVHKQLYVYVDSRKQKGLEDYTISELMAGLFAKMYRPVAENWVYELNQAYFNVSVGRVTLRNNMTRWGSCSSKGNISLAVSLLLAPKEIREYIIIHELAHLQESNHSPNFWQLVEKADPNYREHEAWLKENGHTLKF